MFFMKTRLSRPVGGQSKFCIKFKELYSPSKRTKSFTKLLRRQRDSFAVRNEDLNVKMSSNQNFPYEDTSVNVNRVARISTDRFMLGLIFISCYNCLVMMMSPHEYVTPV